jgi:hypothetical protein
MSLRVFACCRQFLRCHRFRYNSLTIVTVPVTIATSPMKDVARRHTALWGEDGARGRRCKPFPGGSGISLPAL